MQELLELQLALVQLELVLALALLELQLALAQLELEPVFSKQVAKVWSHQNPD